MSQKEQDYRRGVLSDVEDERKEFQQNWTLADKIVGIEAIVVGILKSIMKTATSSEEVALVQVIVCHKNHKEAAQWVANKYRLDLAVSDMLPENEIFITSKDSIEELLKSRYEKIHSN